MAPQKNFEPNPESVRTVRSFVAAALPEGFRSEDIVLTASELATLLEVSDGSSTISGIEGVVDHQWGLRAIEAVSDRWGVESTATRKTVWVEFAQTHSDPYLSADYQWPTS